MEPCAEWVVVFYAGNNRESPIREFLSYNEWRDSLLIDPENRAIYEQELQRLIQWHTKANAQSGGGQACGCS